MKAIDIVVQECDYSREDDLNAVGTLINAYIEDEMGGGDVLSPLQKLRLIDALNEHPKSVVLLACIGDNYCGMLIAFENISTFTVSPMLNIHDLIVLKAFRRKGVGKALLDGLTQVATIRGCGRLSLEVRADNEVARTLYRKEGFGEVDPPMLYWRKYLK